MNSKYVAWTGLVIFLGSIIFLFINGWLFCLVALIGLSLLIISGNIKSKENNKTSHNNKMKILQLISKNNIKYDDIIFGLDNKSSLLFNDKQQKIYFSTPNEIKEYSFSDILESRIVENERIITKTSRTSQIGGALLGGILAGGIGMVVGGLSGSKYDSSKVDNLELYVIVNDIHQPIQKLKFFKHDIGISSKDKNYIGIKNKVEHWYHLISVLIKRADERDKNVVIN